MDECPRCDVPLRVDHRRDIEIDTCPECRGVWLDRGELDKIILRSADSVVPPEPASALLRSRWLEGDRRPARRRTYLSELFND